MRVLIKWLGIAVLLAFSHLAVAQEAGTITVFVLKDGRPAENTEVLIDGDLKLVTDSDGWARESLAPGKHRLEVLARDEQGVNLAYFKKPFTIATGLDTQVVVNYSQNDIVKSVDVEEPVAAAVVTPKQDIATKGSAELVIAVVSSEEKAPIKGARVFLKGTDIDGVTGEDGTFKVVVPADTRVSLSVVHSDYSAQTLNDLVVPKGESLARTVELTPASMELEEFVVLAPNVEGSIATVIEEKRTTSSVAEVLGSEQFSKQGDSSAAGALKRATGLTLVGGKYIFVRGLGERYSNSRLNEMALPSPNPTQRVVPLDMFPTSVVGSIKVQKTWSAELPANFGGGNIDIRTKDTPDEFFANIGLSLKYTDSTTFKDMKTTASGGLDFLGYDDLRGLSSTTKDKVDIDQNVGNFDEDVVTDLLKVPSSVSTTKAMPGFKLSGAIGDSFDVGGEKTLGYFASYAYSQDWNSRTLFTCKATFGSTGEQLAVSKFFESDGYTRNYSHGGLLGLTFDLNEEHKYRLTNFYINIADDSVSEKNGRSDGDTTSFTTSWFERSLLINQLSGVDTFNMLGGLKVDWALEQGTANADEPLTKTYTYKKADEVDFYVLNNGKINYQNNEVHDDLKQFKADFTYPFTFLSNEESKLMFGLTGMTKDRDARSRRFALFFNDNGRFNGNELDAAIDNFTFKDYAKVNLSSRPTESYTAKHEISAFYGNAVLNPLESLELSLGARVENSNQQVTSFEFGAVTNELISDKTLPSFNATYKINDDMQLRFGYAETVTRPDFREFASTRFQDPLTADIIFGNEFLTFSELKHTDLRYEWYLSDVDNITFGLFAKDIQNPIETVVFYTDVNPLFTYINAQDAQLHGAEFSWRKGLGFISETLEGFSFSGNFSYTDSTIHIYEDLTGHIEDSLKAVIGELTSKSRQMQGQSKEVLNLQLGYDSEKYNALLLYNVIGKRIINLGTEGFPDMFEEPFNQLDLVGSYKLNKRFKVGLSFKNILDDEVTWTQGGTVVRKYTKGRSIGVKASYKF
ncbi:MAG: TonB-dependent receptor domain-containing protein [Thiotrichales bacterium]